MTKLLPKILHWKHVEDENLVSIWITKVCLANGHYNSLKWSQWSIAVCQHASPLWELTCHMGSHTWQRWHPIFTLANWGWYVTMVWQMSILKSVIPDTGSGYTPNKRQLAPETVHWLVQLFTYRWPYVFNTHRCKICHVDTYSKSPHLYTLASNTTRKFDEIDQVNS